MKQFKTLFLILVVILLASCVPQTDDQQPAANNLPFDKENQENTSYTLDQIAEHNNADDCWMVLSGKVYDFTDYIKNSSHPGGKTILQGCGQDATELFETRPMGSGTAHSSRARSFHDQYYIGDLQ